MIVKLTSLAIAAATILFGTLPAHAQTQSSETSAATAASDAELDKLEKSTMAIVISGANDIGTQVLGRGAMMSGRGAELSLLDGQIASSLPLYGKTIAWERAGDRRIGSMLVSRRYLVQHEKMLTVWFLTYIKLERGWEVSGMSFNDQIQHQKTDW